jgi:hypothetical protein
MKVVWDVVTIRSCWVKLDLAKSICAASSHRSILTSSLIIKDYHQVV